MKTWTWLFYQQFQTILCAVNMICWLSCTNICQCYIRWGKFSHQPLLAALVQITSWPTNSSNFHSSYCLFHYCLQHKTNIGWSLQNYWLLRRSWIVYSNRKNIFPNKIDFLAIVKLWENLKILIMSLEIHIAKKFYEYDFHFFIFWWRKFVFFVQ